MDYNVGDTIIYTSGGECRVVRVEWKDEDIKNGYPGFDGVIIEGPNKGELVWGYDSQVEQVR